MNYAYEQGADALALTDHGTMAGFSYQVLHSKKMAAEGNQTIQ
jgi:predicted metal-dependent phosphoesterase TrpH